MEAAIVLGLGFIFGAWRLWVAIDRNESGHRRSYPQGGTRAPGYLVAPGRDELHPCYDPGQWEREQSDRGIGREAAAEIEAQWTEAERLEVLTQRGKTGDWARVFDLLEKRNTESEKIFKDLEYRFLDDMAEQRAQS